MIENRIYGPPGSGKTYKIVNEILPKCIDKYGQAGIVVISYTRTAASEIISRLGGRVQTFGVGNNCDELGIDCLEDINNSTKIKAGTLHSLCFHALRMPEIASGKPVYDMFIKEYSSAKILMAGGRLEKIAYLRNKMVGVDDIKDGALKTLWRLWEEFKAKYELSDFTDLIEKCFEMSSAPGLPLCIIADEAQDLTPLQIKLLRHWNKNLEELYLICDDDQSIFSFIGADPKELIRMDLEGVEIRTEILKVSRRLPVKIHKYAKNYIEKIKARKQKEFDSNGQMGEVYNIGCTMGSDRMMKVLLKEVTENKREVMVLASCDYMLNDVIDKMRGLGVPFSNKYKLDDKRWNPISDKVYDIVRKVLKTQTVGDVCDWVELIDMKYIKSDCAFLHHSYGGVKRVDGVKSDGVKSDGVKSDGVKSDGLVASNNVKRRKIIELEAFEKELFYREFLREILVDSEFDAFEDNQEFGSDKDKLDWFMSKIEAKYLKRFDYIYKVMTGEYKDAKDVTVGTIHSAKGRESQVVFVCPDKSPATIKDSLFDKSAIIRLFYVAMTRASEVLYFCMPSDKKNGIVFK
jgi:DNA helicase-2/ATP-dependent DNA helicase PcrA